MNRLTHSPVFIPLIAVAASLPFFLFTILAGIVADKINRKTLLCAVNVWLAAGALGLALFGFFQQTQLFNLAAALAGAGWTLSASELWARGQAAIPDWARGRMTAPIITISQGATVLGGLVWCSLVAIAGPNQTLLTAAILFATTSLLSNLPLGQFRLFLQTRLFLSKERIPALEVPTGTPLVYELDDNLAPRARYYLGDSARAREAQKGIGELMTSSLRPYREPLRPDDESFVQQSLIRSLPYRRHFGRVALSNAMVLQILALRSPEKRHTATATPPLISHTSSS